MTTVSASAPIRVCDLGGWTDTWFAKYGYVLNIAAEPGISVEWQHQEGPAPMISEIATAVLDLCSNKDWNHLAIQSLIPAGSSTGTSASLAVACIRALMSGLERREVASLAWRAETEVLRRQSGVQDQICSAFGGIQFISITDYPHWDTEQVDLRAPFRNEFEEKLLLVLLGGGHDSSALHQQVIAELEASGPMDSRLEELRQCAIIGRASLESEDLHAFGQAMIRNSSIQAALHPDLVSDLADLAIKSAASSGAIGWKVNGAGGSGGSLTLLFESAEDKSVYARKNDIGTALSLRIANPTDPIRR